MDPAAPRVIPTGRVTLLFSDIEGSTALLNRLGDQYADLLDEHDRILRGAFAEFGGYEFSNEGDAFGAAFADPDRAAAAVLAVQRAIAATTWPGGQPVRVRMGLHLGEPRVRGQDYWGEDVHYAARVCSSAHGGQVVLSSAMRSAIPEVPTESLGLHGLKDFSTPRELFQLIVDGQRPADFPPLRSLSAFRSNLPSIAAPIIGRDDVLDELTDLFADGHRLVTLTGAGGMGKTRVAVALGERLACDFPDGVAFVPLAAVDSAGVGAAVAEATGAPRGGDVGVAVVEHLERRRMLVILDNCEHLVEAAAACTTPILERCPQVAVLATAQLPLDLAIERVYRLPALVTGAEMFIDRARAHDQAFRATEADLGRIEELCTLLEGFPLAIELAAARVRLLGLDRLLTALQRNLDALGAGGRGGPDRHHSLRAALDWTLSLLTSAERESFAALGAFAMAWTLEEAEQLLAADLDEIAVWETMTRLMDASLVVVRGDGRFAMPQRVRQHAADLLAGSPANDRVRRRHAEVVAREFHELGLDVFVDYRRELANIVDLLPEVRHGLGWSRGSPDVHRRLVGLTARALAKTGDLALVADDIAAFPACSEEPRDYDDAAICFAEGLLHAMRWSTETAAEVALFDRASRGYARFGDPREVVLAEYQALCALEAGGRTSDISDRAAAMEQAAERLDDSRWRSEVARLLLVGWEDNLTAETLDHLASTWGLGTGGFAVMRAGFYAQAAFARDDLVAAADWTVRALDSDPRDQLYLVLNGVKAVAAILALRQEDADSVVLRAAVDANYHARTGAHHGDLLPRWSEAFAASEARLTADELAGCRTRGALLTYDELVDRAIDLARQFGSASVDQRA